MKRLVFDNYGDPLEVLRIENTLLPVLAEGELLVRMMLRPINPYELAIIAGNEDERAKFPQVPGFEGVGVVEDAGIGATAFLKGQRVITMPADLAGTWQEFVIGRSNQFISVPDGVSDVQAALILNPLTCFVVLRNILNIDEGQWVLNTAASTNIGQLLIQFARIFKFKLINLVRDNNSEKHIKSIGAEHIINTERDDLISVVERLTNGCGVNGIIDPVGGSIGSLAAKILKFGGKMVLFSNMSTQMVCVDPMEFISKKLTMVGYTSKHWLNEHSYDEKADVINNIFDLIQKGSLTLRADGYYPLHEFAAAIIRSKESGRPGKVFLT